MSLVAQEHFLLFQAQPEAVLTDRDLFSDKFELVFTKLLSQVVLQSRA